ncbi:RNA polymerase sigma factor [Phocaeicola sp.]
MSNDETHIIQDILNGKTARFEYFLDKYGQQVFTLIVRIVSSQEDAEELTQDTFLKAFQHLSAFKAESNFSTWIYRIAYNTAISATRKKKYDVFAMDDTQLANISDEQVDHTLNDESEEQLGKLNRAMDRLDADERAVITLFYMEEKPVNEIALILGLTESNAKVKLHRIRKKLYVLIKQEEQ